jgi:hypothetical protein
MGGEPSTSNRVKRVDINEKWYHVLMRVFGFDRDTSVPERDLGCGAWRARRTTALSFLFKTSRMDFSAREHVWENESAEERIIEIAVHSLGYIHLFGECDAIPLSRYVCYHTRNVG